MLGLVLCEILFKKVIMMMMMTGVNFPCEHDNFLFGEIIIRLLKVQLVLLVT